MKRLAPLLLLLFLLTTVTLGPVQAQEGISTSSTAEVRLPTELTFNVTAESAADITEITYRVKQDVIKVVLE